MPETPAADEKGTPPSPAAPAAAPVAAAVPSVATVPESYTFTFPDKTLLDKDGTAKRLTERLKGLKVTDGTVAQSYLDAAHGEVASTMEAYVAAHRPDGAAFKAMVDAHTAEALAAPDLGAGDPLRLEQKALNAKLVLGKYAAQAPKAVQVLTESGVLHNPEVLRLLNAFYDATKEPGSPPPAGAGVVEPSGWAGLFPNGVPDFTGEVTALKP